MLMTVAPRGEIPSAPQAPRPAAAGSIHELWLLGQPPLTRLLEFVEDSVVDEAHFDRRALADAWRAANDVYLALEASEAGAANQGAHRELDAALRPLADRVRSHPSFRQSFQTLPTEFAMVDLDHLIVDQQHVTQTFVDGIAARLGPSPAAEQVFDLCMPLDAPDTPVQAQKVGSRRWVFRSRSLDFRFHAAELLRAEQLPGHASFGPVAGVVGLVIGYGCNLLNVVRVGKRVLLANGYHRAVALRQAGVRFAPCVMQTATRVDELQVCVKSRIADHADFYFESARPPLLKDFFDPRLTTRLPIRPRMRQIEVSFEVKDHLVCD